MSSLNKSRECSSFGFSSSNAGNRQSYVYSIIVKCHGIMKLNPSVCLKILLTRNKQSLGAYKDLQFCRLERAPDLSSMFVGFMVIRDVLPKRSHVWRVEKLKFRKFSFGESCLEQVLVPVRLYMEKLTTQPRNLVPYAEITSVAWDYVIPCFSAP